MVHGFETSPIGILKVVLNCSWVYFITHLHIIRINLAINLIELLNILDEEDATCTCTSTFLMMQNVYRSAV